MCADLPDEPDPQAEESATLDAGREEQAPDALARAWARVGNCVMNGEPMPTPDDEELPADPGRLSRHRRTPQLGTDDPSTTPFEIA